MGGAGHALTEKVQRSLAVLLLVLSLLLELLLLEKLLALMEMMKVVLVVLLIIIIVAPMATLVQLPERCSLPAGASFGIKLLLKLLLLVLRLLLLVLLMLLLLLMSQRRWEDLKAYRSRSRSNGVSSAAARATSLSVLTRHFRVEAADARLAGNLTAVLGFGLDQWLEVIKDQGRTPTLSPPEEQQLAKVIARDPIEQE